MKRRRRRFIKCHVSQFIPRFKKLRQRRLRNKNPILKKLSRRKLLYYLDKSGLRGVLYTMRPSRS